MRADLNVRVFLHILLLVPLHNFVRDPGSRVKQATQEKKVDLRVPVSGLFQPASSRAEKCVTGTFNFSKAPFVIATTIIVSSLIMAEKHDVKIAVIGGSGLYHLDNLEFVEEVHPETVSR